MEPVDMDEEKLEERTGSEAPVLIPSLRPSLSLFVSVFLPLSLFLQTYFADLWYRTGLLSDSPLVCPLQF